MVKPYGAYSLISGEFAAFLDGACTLFRDGWADVIKMGAAVEMSLYAEGVSTTASLTLGCVTTRVGSKESPFLTRLLRIGQEY